MPVVQDPFAPVSSWRDPLLKAFRAKKYRNWVKGEWGKGVLLHTDEGSRVVTWTTTKWGNPTHQTVVGLLHEMDMGGYPMDFIVIEPGGAYTDAQMRQDLDKEVMTAKQARMYKFQRSTKGLSYVADPNRWVAKLPARTSDEQLAKIIGQPIPKGILEPELALGEARTLEQEIALARERMMTLDRGVARDLSREYMRIIDSLQSDLDKLNKEAAAARLAGTKDLRPWTIQSERYRTMIEQYEKRVVAFINAAADAIAKGQRNAVGLAELAAREVSVRALLPENVHGKLVEEALRSWKGGPAEMRLALNSVLTGKPMPKVWTREMAEKATSQARSLLWELQNAAKTNDVPLFRAAFTRYGPEGKELFVTSWTEQEKVARGFKGTNRQIFRAEPGTVRGLRLADYGGKMPMRWESEWLIPTPDGPINKPENQIKPPFPDAEREAIVRGSFNKMNWSWVQNMVGRTATGTPLADLLASAAGTAAEATRQTIVDGVAKGQSMRTLAADVANVASMPLQRALTICRQEIIGMYRETSSQQYRASQVVKGWVWSCDWGPRTCEVCAAMDGTHFPVTETLDSHIQCRCAMLPETKTWDELGFHDIKDTQAALKIRPGPETFAKLPEQTQRAILGPSKFSAYQKGTFKLEDTVRMTDHPIYGQGRRAATLRELGLPHVRTAPTVAPGISPGTARWLAKGKAPRPGRTSPKLASAERAAQDAIGDVIQVPDYIPRPRVLPKSLRARGMRKGRYQGWAHKDGKVMINPDGDHLISTTVHEYGHFFDNKVLPRAFGADTWAVDAGAIYSSGMKQTAGLRKAIEGSATFQKWANQHKELSKIVGHDVPMSSFAQYMTGERECFARAFAQYIQMNAGSRHVELARNIIRERMVQDDWYWDAAEFRPIAREFDKLFRKAKIKI